MAPVLAVLPTEYGPLEVQFVVGSHDHPGLEFRLTVPQVGLQMQMQNRRRSRRSSLDLRCSSSVDPL